MRSISLSAQGRLTAVGRVSNKALDAAWTAAWKRAGSPPLSASAARAARAIPMPAVTPSAGAPRTVMLQMASATCCQVVQRTSTSSRGRRRWSMSTTAPSRHRTGRMLSTASTPAICACAAWRRRLRAAPRRRFPSCSGPHVPTAEVLHLLGRQLIDGGPQRGHLQAWRSPGRRPRVRRTPSSPRSRRS